MPTLTEMYAELRAAMKSPPGRSITWPVTLPGVSDHLKGRTVHSIILDEQQETPPMPRKSSPPPAVQKDALREALRVTIDGRVIDVPVVEALRGAEALATARGMAPVMQLSPVARQVLLEEAAQDVALDQLDAETRDIVPDAPALAWAETPPAQTASDEQWQAEVDWNELAAMTPLGRPLGKGVTAETLTAYEAQRQKMDAARAREMERRLAQAQAPRSTGIAARAEGDWEPFWYGGDVADLGDE